MSANSPDACVGGIEFAECLLESERSNAGRLCRRTVGHRVSSSHCTDYNAMSRDLAHLGSSQDSSPARTIAEVTCTCARTLTPACLGTRPVIAFAPLHASDSFLLGHIERISSTSADVLPRRTAVFACKMVAALRLSHNPT